MAAVLGGTQSLHTNSFDEALSLPTEAAAKIALRTQQVLGYETGVAETVDPLGGSYYVESLTDELERLARGIPRRGRRPMGGAVAAIEAGFYQDEIHEAAFRIQRGIESGERVVVGVNRFVDEAAEPVELQRISEEETVRQVERLVELRAGRDGAAVADALGDVEDTAAGPATCFRRCARRCGGARRSARSPTPCVGCSASTEPPCSPVGCAR